MNKKLLPYLFFYSFPLFFSFHFSFAQVHKSNKIDSLETILHTVKEDTTEVNILIELTRQYGMFDAPKAIQYGESAIALAKKNNYTQGVIRSLNITGTTYYFYGNLTKALDSFFQLLKIQESAGNNSEIASYCNNIAEVYNMQGNYEMSIEFYLRALKIKEKMNDKQEMILTFSNIGNIFEKENNYVLAEGYYLKAMKLAQEIGDKEDIANSYNYIAGLCILQKNYQKALKYCLKSLEIKKGLGDKNGIAGNYDILGAISDKQMDYQKTKEYFLKSLTIKKEIGDKHGLSIAYGNLGEVCAKQNNFAEAFLYVNKALALAKEAEYVEGINTNYFALSELYAQQHNYKQAYAYYKLYSEMKDTLFNAENSKSIARMQTIYETEKKDKEIKLLNKDKEIQSANLKKQRIINYSISAGLMLVIVLVFFISRSYLQKQKANLALTLAYKEIAEKNKIVEEKNKDITDSIIYAKRIQQAILPPTDVIQKTFPQSFILYKPKDIVSGDFYWFNKISENEILLAVVDCTGHGVPGAFMSMIGNDLLNQIVIEKGSTEPNLILDQLHEAVVKALRQYDEEEKNRDGMDVALCGLEFSVQSSETTHPTPNSQLSAILHYAGAMRPLYVIRNTGQTPHSQLIEIKGNKFPIGGIQTGEKRMFTNHTLQLNQGDTLYLFSDGYVDQFGGSEGKKLMTKKFKELLLEIHNKSMQEQKEMLTKTFSEWQGELEQVDDVLIIGIKV